MTKQIQITQNVEAMNIYQITLKDSQGKCIHTFFFDSTNLNLCKKYALTIADYPSISQEWQSICISKFGNEKIICQRERKGTWNN